MEACKISNLYNLDETIAKDLFEGATYPWEVLPKISAFILQLGSTLSDFYVMEEIFGSGPLLQHLQSAGGEWNGTGHFHASYVGLRKQR